VRSRDFNSKLPVRRPESTSRLRRQPFNFRGILPVAFQVQEPDHRHSESRASPEIRRSLLGCDAAPGRPRVPQRIMALTPSRSQPRRLQLPAAWPQSESIIRITPGQGLDRRRLGPANATRRGHRASVQTIGHRRLHWPLALDLKLPSQLAVPGPV
jgi:hypothetical protein